MYIVGDKIVFKMAIIRGIDRFQMRFSTLEDCISEEHEVRFIDAFVDKLDLKKLGVVSLTQATKKKGWSPVLFRRYISKIIFICLLKWSKE